MVMHVMAITLMMRLIDAFRVLEGGRPAATQSDRLRTGLAVAAQSRFETRSIRVLAGCFADMRAAQCLRLNATRKVTGDQS